MTEEELKEENKNLKRRLEKVTLERNNFKRAINNILIKINNKVI